MKYILLVLCGSFLLSSPCLSQSHETNIEYDKKKQKALVAEYAYSQEAVENAITDRLEKLGNKGKEEKGIFNKDKGFRIYKGARIKEITQHSMDYIIYVEQKSKKEKDAALVYLIINNKDGENVIETPDEELIGKAKEFLNNLHPYVESAHLELLILDQVSLVSKAEKKLKGLEDDKSDMEKKIQKLQDDIKKNEKDQENTRKDIETQKQNLDTLKGKRKNVV